MPRYFFDIHEGSRLISDPSGTELADLAQAKIEATQTLAEISRESIPASPQNRLEISVRDEQGRPVLRLELTFKLTEL